MYGGEGGGVAASTTQIYVCIPLIATTTIALISTGFPTVAKIVVSFFDFLIFSETHSHVLSQQSEASVQNVQSVQRVQSNLVEDSLSLQSRQHT